MSSHLLGQQVKKTATRDGKNVQRLESSQTVHKKGKWDSHFEKLDAVSQKVEQSYHMTQQFYS